MRNRQKHQAGFTLIELMVGLLVGLIVLSAVIYSFLVTLRSSRDVVNASLVTNEIGLQADLMSGEIRRAGFNRDSSLMPSDDVLVVVSGSVVSDYGDCILYVYDNDATSGLTGEAYRGFRLKSGSLQFSSTISAATISNECVNDSVWTSLNDPRVIFDELSFHVVSDAIGVGDVMFTVDLTISANVASDPAWKASIQNKTIEVRNDY